MAYKRLLLAVAVPLLLLGTWHTLTTNGTISSTPWLQRLANPACWQHSCPAAAAAPAAAAVADAAAAPTEVLAEEAPPPRAGGSSGSTAPKAPPRAAVQAGVQPSCRLQGMVDETANCTYEAVDQMNQHDLHPLLSKLVRTAFFRYFKVNIHCDCPLWPDDAMCALSDCSVCECEPSEVPKPWLSDEKSSCSAAVAPEGAEPPTAELCSTARCVEDAESRVDSRLEPDVSHALSHLQGWRGLNNPWMAGGEDDEQYLYINLLANPERYTGYKGEHAQRIWNAIYSQSCFEGPHCPETRVFYRLISGMHSSIAAHIAANFLLTEEEDEDAAPAHHPFGAAAGSPFGGRASSFPSEWGPSLAQFEARLGTPALRDRVENLYFAYLFVLRAVMKVAPSLESYTYDTGLPVEDATTVQLVKELAGRRELQASCPVPFDEGRLWKGAEGPALRERLRASFQNITRIMDCVGCEKCKLWGKLQTLGIATALKILFSSADCGEGPAPSTPPPLPGLERNELIALVNLLTRLSKSLEIYRTMSAQLATRRGTRPVVNLLGSVA